VPKPVINLDELEFRPRPEAMRATGPAATVFDANVAQVSSRIGAQKLGFNVTAVPAGKAAFPFHSHRANEELFFVLQGSGVVRVGKETYPIRPGDFIACPPGGPETAHQIRNTGSEELRYVAISTLIYPELAEYPDSGKFGVYARVPGAPPGSPGEFRYVGRESLSAGYWDGEGQSGA
jgi:uncharacterized cupin superfamily protein